MKRKIAWSNKLKFDGTPQQNDTRTPVNNRKLTAKKIQIKQNYFKIFETPKIVETLVSGHVFLLKHDDSDVANFGKCFKACIFFLLVYRYLLLSNTSDIGDLGIVL